MNNTFTKYKTNEERELIISKMLEILDEKPNITYQEIQKATNLALTTAKNLKAVIDKFQEKEERESASVIAKQVIEMYNLNGHRIQLIEQFSDAYEKHLNKAHAQVHEKSLIERIKEFQEIAEKIEKNEKRMYRHAAGGRPGQQTVCPDRRDGEACRSLRR